MTTTQTANVLIVEDDLKDHREIRQELELLGLNVSDAHNVEDAKKLFYGGNFQLVLLHLGDAPLESLKCCRNMKAISTVPVIMLTSRSEPVDEAMAMAAGADDYIVKPINVRLLTARITQQLNRQQQSTSQPSDAVTNVLVWGDLKLDPKQHLFWVGEEVVSLTATEHQMMNLFMTNPTQVFSREQLLRQLGMATGVGSDHIVDSHASRIRKKIRDCGGPEVIHVVRSIGFRLS